VKIQLDLLCVGIQLAVALAIYLDHSSQQCLDDELCHLVMHNCGVARDCVKIRGFPVCV